MIRASVGSLSSVQKIRFPQSCIRNRLPFVLVSRHYSSSFSQLKKDMTARSLPPLHDPCSYLNSYLLSSTLEEFLPPPLARELSLHFSNGQHMVMPFAHHLVYFPPPLPLSSLQQDGTDPLHSPGPPFTRRMWAGGKIDYSDLTLILNDGPAICFERITDLLIRGQEGQEKALVRIERRARPFEKGDDELTSPVPPFEMKEEFMGRNYSEAEAGDPLEVRNLIFLRDDFRKSTSDKTIHHPKFIKPSEAPDFSHILIPSAALLFRFSALTFNAHAIHLDKDYCREIEGHRNLLVHGPLTVILMVELLRRHLENGLVRSERLSDVVPRIRSIEYRNLAPLYAEEEMKICGKKKKDDEYAMWIEGKEGGLAVRGAVRTGLGFSEWYLHHLSRCMVTMLGDELSPSFVSGCGRRTKETNV